MYIHNTGYVIKYNHFVEKPFIPSFFYTLSTESSYFFEFLGHFWVRVTEPFNFMLYVNDKLFTKTLMGMRCYYLEVRNPGYPVEIKYPPRYAKSTRYRYIFSSEK